MKYLLFLLKLLLTLFINSTTSRSTSVDFCIVGAGPAGLQIAYFLHNTNKNYIVFEKNSISGISQK